MYVQVKAIQDILGAAKVDDLLKAGSTTANKLPQVSVSVAYSQRTDKGDTEREGRHIRKTDKDGTSCDYSPALRVVWMQRDSCVCARVFAHERLCASMPLGPVYAYAYTCIRITCVYACRGIRVCKPCHTHPLIRRLCARIISEQCVRIYACRYTHTRVGIRIRVQLYVCVRVRIISEQRVHACARKCAGGAALVRAVAAEAVYARGPPGHDAWGVPEPDRFLCAGGIFDRGDARSPHVTLSGV